MLRLVVVCWCTVLLLLLQLLPLLPLLLRLVSWRWCFEPEEDV
jgi:hypothetical protein